MQSETRMSTREQRIEVFEDTMKWCREETELQEAIRRTIAGTCLYMEDDYPAVRQIESGRRTEIAVTKSRTFEAALRLRQEYPDARIAVHNFASATNPGGGVTNGSSAQEECLCRCSTLYPALRVSQLWAGFYQYHRDRHDTRYTDACVYSPDIRVIKTDTDLPRRMPKIQWCTVDVMTCAAPNLREKPYNRMNPGEGEAIPVSDGELLAIHEKRARHMLTIAAAHQAEILVLGAFGCGAFQNDPQIVAEAYRKVTGEFSGYFTRIEFAIYCPPQGSVNYETFKKVLG